MTLKVEQLYSVTYELHCRSAKRIFAHYMGDYYDSEGRLWLHFNDQNGKGRCFLPAELLQVSPFPIGGNR